MNYLLPLGAAMARFTELVDAAFGDEPIPAQPGWKVDDTTVHLGADHRWAAATVLGGSLVARNAAPRTFTPLSDWYANSAAALLAAFQAVDPSEPVANPTRIDESVRFWLRRQAHETTIRAVDVAEALGLGDLAVDIEPRFAADGIEEVLGVMLPVLTGRGQRPDLRGAVRVTATDLPRSWVVRPGEDSFATPLVRVDTGEFEIIGEISGVARDLYLTFWKRLPANRVRMVGEAAAALVTGPTVPGRLD
jgi:uncharacterized protein (TIGR03083 family)